MKKLSLFMLAAAGCLALTSCSGNDDDNNNGNVNASLEGTFELTSLIAPNTQDYDNDGDSNTNLVLEGDCYNDSWISFHTDGTYDEGFSSSVLADGGLSLSCDTKIASGTYMQTGNSIATTKTSGEGTASATYTFDSSSHTLIRTENAGSYAGWNTATSLFANFTGNLQFTYTKYTNNDNDNGDSDDDDDNIDADAMAALTGNFDLSSYIVGTAQDLNHDGSGSTNLMTESNCYSASNITLHSDGTYDETSSGTIITGSGLDIDCDAEIETTGTWTRNGDMVTTRHASGNTNVSTQYMFNASSHTLSRSDATAEYPTFNTATSLFANLTGNVDYTYTKD
jgi:hypothetical protein